MITCCSAQTSRERGTSKANLEAGEGAPCDADQSIALQHGHRQRDEISEQQQASSQLLLLELEDEEDEGLLLLRPRRLDAK